MNRTTPWQTIQMKRQYRQLVLTDRDRIKILHDDGFSIRKIAKALGISHSTVSRELRRNARSSTTQYGQPGAYEPLVAQHKTYLRRRLASFQGKKIEHDRQLRDYVITALRAGWNPDEISGRLKRMPGSPYVSKTTIYEWLYSARGQAYCQYLPRQRHRPKRRRHTAKPGMVIPHRTSIHQRPERVSTRQEAGHWEGDTIVSGKYSRSTASLVVMQERKTRYIAVRQIPNLAGKTFSMAVSDILAGKRAATLTLDNGVENREHSRITAKHGTDVYFCDPYSSWQKGGVEHANKMLRSYVPKGSDLADFDAEYIDWAVRRINNKPRRCLGYKSAVELAVEEGVFTGASGALGG